MASYKPPSRGTYAESISLYEGALALDPQSVEAQTLLANALLNRVREFMTDSPAADIERAEGLVRQGAQCSSRVAVRARPPCLGVWPQGRDRTRRHRARRSPQATRRGCLFEHRPVEGHFRRIRGGAAPKTRALFEATYFAGLRKAGLPEE
jgi:hypothetical protein